MWREHDPQLRATPGHMGSNSPGLSAQVQSEALTEVRNSAPLLDLWARDLGLRLAHSAQCPLYPWTFLLDKWINVPERETARHDDLDAVCVDQDSRM
jgi:hypothetical protein